MTTQIKQDIAQGQTNLRLLIGRFSDFLPDSRTRDENLTDFLTLLFHVTSSLFMSESAALRLTNLTREQCEDHHIQHGDMLAIMLDATSRYKASMDDVECMAAVKEFGERFLDHTESYDALVLANLA